MSVPLNKQDYERLLLLAEVIYKSGQGELSIYVGDTGYISLEIKTKSAPMAEVERIFGTSPGITAEKGFEEGKVKASQIFILLFVGTAVGCAIWFGFFHDWHEINRTISIENRHAEAVGAKPLPVEPVHFEIATGRNDCFVIDSAEFDGERLWVKYHAVCSESFEALRWQEFSPDEMLINANYEWITAGNEIPRGTKGEFRASEDSFTLDPRAVKIKLHISRE